MSENEKAGSAKTAAHVDRTEQSDHLKPTATVDTVHNDEALKVIQGYDGDSVWTVAEEKRLRRKVDWKLMPILCFTYGLVYYDKAMLGQAVSSHLDLLLGRLILDIQLADFN